MWLEEIQDMFDSHWPLADDCIVTCFLDCFNDAFLAGKPLPSWS